MKAKVSILSLVAVFASFYVMGFVDLIGIATNYVKQDFALTDAVANLLPLMLFVWFAILSIPTSVLMGKIGRKNTVLISISISALAMLVPLIFYTFPMMLFAFALLGIGNTIIQVALNPLLSNVVDESKLTGSITLGQFIKSLAAFLAPIITAMAVAYTDSWKLIFLFSAIVSVLSGLLLYIGKIDENNAKTEVGSMLQSLLMLKNPLIVLYFLAIVFVVGIDVGLNTNISGFISERCNIPLEQSTLAISVYFASKTLGLFLGTFLLIKVSEKKFYIYSLLIGIPAFFAMLFMNDVLYIYILLFIAGLSASNIFSIIFSVAIKRFPEARNAVSGLMIMAVAGGALIPLLIGFVSDLFGRTFGIGILGIAFIYLLFVGLRLKKE